MRGFPSVRTDALERNVKPTDFEHTINSTVATTTGQCETCSAQYQLKMCIFHEKQAFEPPMYCPMCGERLGER